MTNEAAHSRRAIYAKYGPTWTWYTDVEFTSDDTVHIHRHWSLHNRNDSDHPSGVVITHVAYDLIEEPGRTVVALRVCDNEFKVDNPRYIFWYDAPADLLGQSGQATPGLSHA